MTCKSPCPGSEPVYLDHAATSFPKAPGVIEAVSRFLGSSAGNPGRGGHRLTVAASRAVETSREQVAELLGCHPERTLFGAGATFWLSTALTSLLQPGDRVITSSLEHNAVMRPLHHLQRTIGAHIEPVYGQGGGGVPSPCEIAEEVRRAPTAAVVLTHASNVTGAVIDVETVAREVAPVPLIVDGSQAAGAWPFSFDQSSIAAYICSGHKGLLGPTGVGVLLLARGVEIQPLIRGGTGSRSESYEMPELLPDRLEAGTPATAAIAGLGAACEWLAGFTVERAHEHQISLTRQAINGLSKIPGVCLPGLAEGDVSTSQSRLGVLSFSIEHRDLGEVAANLDRRHGLMLRAGLHCAPAAHRRLGTFPEGTLRASFGPFCDADAADRLIEAARTEAGA